MTIISNQRRTLWITRVTSELTPSPKVEVEWEEDLEETSRMTLW